MFVNGIIVQSMKYPPATPEVLTSRPFLVTRIRLEPKPDAQRRDPPQTAQETLMQLAQERGTSLIPLAAMKAAGS